MPPKKNRNAVKTGHNPPPQPYHELDNLVTTHNHAGSTRSPAPPNHSTIDWPGESSPSHRFPSEFPPAPNHQFSSEFPAAHNHHFPSEFPPVLNPTPLTSGNGRNTSPASRGDSPPHRFGGSPPRQHGGSPGTRLAKSEVESLNERLRMLNEENDELLDKLGEAKRLRDRREREHDVEILDLRSKIAELETGHHQFLVDIAQLKTRIEPYENLNNAEDLQEKLAASERGREESERREEALRKRVETEFRRLDEEEAGRLEEKLEVEAKLTTIRKDYDVMIASLTAKYNGLKEELDDSRDVIRELQALNDTLAQRADANEQTKQWKNKEGEDHHRRLEHEADKLRQTMLDNETMRLDFERKSREANGEILRLISALAESERQLDNAERLLSESKSSGEQGDKGESVRKDAEIDQLRKALSEREKKLREVVTQMAAAEEKDMYGLKSTVHQLEEKLVREKRENAEGVQRLKNEWDGKQKSLEARVKELMLADQGTVVLSNANKHLKELIQQRDGEVESLKKSLRNSIADVETLRKELEHRSVAQSEDLLRSMEEKEQELKVAYDALDTLKEEFDRISSESNAATDALNENKELRDRLLQESKKSKELKGELERFKKQLNDFAVANASAIDAANQKNKHLTESLKNAENEAKAAKDSLANFSKELEKFKSDDAKHKSELTQCKREMEGVKNESDKIRIELKNTKAAVVNPSESNDSKQLLEMTEKNGKLERALVRLKLENDDYRAGKETKTEGPMRRLLLEKESHIFDLQKEVSSLRAAIQLQPTADPTSSLANHSDIQRSLADVDIMKNKYQDILTAHRRLLEETASLRAAAGRQAHPSPERPPRGGAESPNSRELIQTKKQLESSSDRIAQLERWLDEIYTNPEIGLGPPIRAGGQKGVAATLRAGGGVSGGLGQEQGVGLSLPELRQGELGRKHRSPVHEGKRSIPTGRQHANRAKPVWDSQPRITRLGLQ